MFFQKGFFITLAENTWSLNKGKMNGISFIKRENLLVTFPMHL